MDKNNIKIKFEKEDLTNIEIFNTINDLSLNNNIIKNQLAFSRSFFNKKEVQEIYKNLIQQLYNKRIISNTVTHGSVLKIYPNDNVTNLKTISPNIPDKLLSLEKILFEKFDILKLTRIQIVDTLQNPQDKNIMPFCLHTDKLIFFKVMIYLMDIEIENGPLHIVPVNSNGLEKMITYKNKNNFYEKHKKNWLNIPARIDSELDTLAMEGPIGSIVLFNAHIPHKAGMLKNNKIRKVIILEYENHKQYNWRKDNNIISGKDF